MFAELFFNSLFSHNEFTEVRQDWLHFNSIMNPTHYESISVTWADILICVITVIEVHDLLLALLQVKTILAA